MRKCSAAGGPLRCHRDEHISCHRSCCCFHSPNRAAMQHDDCMDRDVWRSLSIGFSSHENCSVADNLCLGMAKLSKCLVNH